MLNTPIKLLEKIQNSVSFRNKIFIFILVSMGFQLAFIADNFRSALLNTLEHQVGTRALVQAEEIASDPSIIKAVSQRNIPELESIVGRLRKISDANFIVVGDDKKIRLSHPVTDLIGTPMQSTDNEGVLQKGKSYISFNSGSLGYSVRGKTPVKNSQGKIIGVVSVGYLIDRIDGWLIEYAKPLYQDFFIILFITLVVGWLFSNHVKKNMNGKEPAEIAFAYNMRKSIMQSVYEGIIAIDKKGKILTVNNTARALIGTEKSPKELQQHNITDFINQGQFFFHTPFEENLNDELIKINNNVLIANRVAIFDQDKFIGWVISFRKKEEISSLTKELAQVKQYTDSLRALRDNYENRMSTVAGLLEMGDINTALEFIYSDKHRKQEIIDFIVERIHCKQVAGILIGKAARARELGLELQFDPLCQLMDEKRAITISELSAVIGNLLDNAFEASQKNPESNNVVSFLISDAGKELVIEVKDNGCGIDPEFAMTMFSKGVSSKNAPEKDASGVGLYLINRYVNHAGGVILVDDAKPKGTIFSIFIPKTEIIENEVVETESEV
ncbi:ATP-binding protein [Vibrio salinus]|uniref:ATP-binding protein n=1 Tax=Vibrio salinus TaxID=2899784 RepID=UPI001E392718|nr:sensor histidine kinase [Vibrio salinus]MCE0492793.1 sensor histidine kinase [Vibrio salinus]